MSTKNPKPRSMRGLYGILFCVRNGHALQDNELSLLTKEQLVRWAKKYKKTCADNYSTLQKLYWQGQDRESILLKAIKAFGGGGDRVGEA